MLSLDSQILTNRFIREVLQEIFDTAQTAAPNRDRIDTQHLIDRFSNWTSLIRLVAPLLERRNHAVTRYFGLEYKARATLKTIGEELGVTAKRAGMIKLEGCIDILKRAIHIDANIRLSNGESPTTVPLEALWLNAQATNAFHRAGHLTVADVTNMTKENVLDTRGIGRYELRDVVAKLKQHGLSLSAL